MQKNILISDFIPPIFFKFMRAASPSFRRKFQEIKTLPLFFDERFQRQLNSFSQFQEDVLIDLLLESKPVGFYADIGANDPAFNSNTNRFYQRGWNGINVEPGIDAFNRLRECRKRDLNLNIGVGPKRSDMMFYSLKDGTLSSFSKINAEKMSRIHNSPITPIRIEVWPLKEVFEKHLDGRMIDFMSVDVEGFDLCVLKSNDWNQFRPTLLIVEMNNEYEEIVDFLRNNNYLLIFNNLYNGIFIDLRTRENHLRKIIET